MDDGRHTGGGRALTLIVVAVLVAAGFFAYRGEPPRWSPFAGAGDATRPVTSTVPPPPLDPVAVAAAVSPALVHISTSTRAFGPGAAGSGIVLTAEGQVLTSHHVVKGADRVVVTLVDTGRIFTATVLGYDSSADIALLELPGAAGLTAAQLGNAADLRIRDEVLAIGNAGGTGGEPTAIAGRITALNSTIVALNSADLSRKALTGMLEVAAAVSSGQSGGALADRFGAVVGVITAASGEREESERPREPNGYAVPIETAMRVVRQIRSGSPTDSVHIGPTATLGVLISDAAPTGARVDVAIYGSPAYAAGLSRGEIVTAVDGRAITTARALRSAINVRRPGDTVQLVVLGTDGEERTVTVVLAEGTPN
ncbi:trypsin-like peptidase domain-containing protein [Nocardia puris]|uniref:S1C family serine protease n=1 Tax=Nocardia puris TaxID=208602 RepID=UPI001893B431|nr:trypsin-like peptidase domain-containing protein [Nocardia puris]MBF6211308.1 trypsin-like peptidase domain-containing protein [Nocardia puris]MBF6365027.1 trypsin-like peptidase domain-containing protein [Nocardia puris]MBF6458812.1 trypsin-like peptidase domain-containing protein [Nocardia puris]